MSILEKGQNAGENISFIEERKRRLLPIWKSLKREYRKVGWGKQKKVFGWHRQKDL